MNGRLRAVRYVQLTTPKSQDGINEMTHSQGIACKNRPWCWILPMAGAGKGRERGHGTSGEGGAAVRKLEDGPQVTHDGAAGALTEAAAAAGELEHWQWRP